ncbi:LysM peptidoglycan-binding domain-containing protein [Salmonirosea aquatica]|uniref:LysM peptidoglycan-binding domain-containing protein n=1 Tax=Salmonirosea aquatica TaxID=2654236 RepID=A0A7C9FYH2_9BACT|nr:LysM peptidoglycan-binding domain-containing protein [Cytophagaceae bacterium SJW1-29]
MKYAFGQIFLMVCFIALMSPASAISGSGSVAALRDSIGTERANGKTYILHKVDAGQTLYAVMRRYGVPVGEIKAANAGMADNLRTDQVIRVPYTPPKSSRASAREERIAAREEKKKNEEKKTEPAPATAPAVKSAPGIHKVEQGQTLYSIAVKYGVLMADVRKWNGLTSDNVQLGQDLIVSEKAYSERRPSVTPFPAPKAAEKTEPTPPPVATVEKPKKPVVEETKPEPEPKETTGRRMSESGLAELIDTEESSSKYLALHRSAPLGTLIEVKNQYNQEKIWVKVVGRIPSTSINEDIVIKLSARAFEKLSPNSRRFRAEINYISAN